MGFTGETTPGGSRAENPPPGLWSSDRTYPCSPPDKSGICGSIRADGGSPFRGGKGQEEVGSGGTVKVSRPLPRREPHPSETVTLSAGENRSQTPPVGSQEGVAAVGKGLFYRVREPRAS